LHLGFIPQNSGVKVSCQISWIFCAFDARKSTHLKKISSSLLADEGKEHYTTHNGTICHTRTNVYEKMMESFFTAY
jgi:hypothetical protein